MKHWRERLHDDLEPKLACDDPRPAISAYHDMPYAIFHYPPADEFEVRKEISLLRIRLEQKGKRVHVVSLANCLQDAWNKAGIAPQQLIAAEKKVGIGATIDTLHSILDSRCPLDALVIGQLPAELDPLRDIVFITRAGALYPFYRTSALLEQLKGQLAAPGVLFYPGGLDGPAGLKFMDILEAEHNYRPRIY